MKISTDTNRPILLQTTSQTMLTLAADRSATCHADVYVNGNINTPHGSIRSSSITTSIQPFLHVSATPSSGVGTIIPFSQRIDNKGTVVDGIYCALSTGGPKPQGTFTFPTIGLYQFEIAWQWDGAFNSLFTRYTTAIWKNGVSHARRMDLRPATSGDSGTFSLVQYL